MNIYQTIINKSKQGKKQFAILVDPDKYDTQRFEKIAQSAQESKADYLFVGGSLLTNGNFHNCIKILKANSTVPVILFPGNTLQIDEQADAILFLSLISGRNPDLLIGKHVISAPLIKEKKIECISTGYMLIESGNSTSVLYMSNTQPIPHNKTEIAASTALAGEMLGLKLIYLEAGSGALNPVSEEMIRTVKKNITVPLITGGGIKSPEKALAGFKAGANIIVMGNSIENNPELIKEIADAIR